MAGISVYPEVGSIVVGKYLVKDHIDDGGKGGNYKKFYDNYLLSIIRFSEMIVSTGIARL